MEPSGRNRWPPVANAEGRKRQKQAKPVAVGCDQSPPNLDGKEGVDRSSPSEGLKYLRQPASRRNAFTSAANSLWCWKRKPWAESG